MYKKAEQDIWSENHGYSRASERVENAGGEGRERVDVGVTVTVGG